MEKVDSIFLCNPSNPSGQIIDRDVLDRIIEICKNREITLIIDECFLDLYKFYDHVTGLNLIRNIFDDCKVIILKAFTKIYAMAGVRLGYAICSDLKMAKMIENYAGPWMVSGLAQFLGIEILKDKDFIKRTRNIIKNERTYMIEEMTQIGFVSFKPYANYIFFKGPKDLQINMRKYGIEIRDCSDYKGLPNKDNYFRVAVMTRSSNDIVLEALKKV